MNGARFSSREMSYKKQDRVTKKIGWWKSYLKVYHLIGRRDMA